jgi:SNF2 family DNA or RNA helicase
VTNTESFATYKEHFDQIKFTGCFVDESSDMKSHKSKQSQAIVDFAHTVKRFYLLSGTPAPNGEWEYYKQLQAIDYYCVPPYWTHFKEHYFVDISFSQYEQLQMRPDRKDEFDALLKRYAIYVDKEDVLTLPGREFIEVELELPDELKKHYRTLKNELYLEVADDKKLTAPSSAAKLNKLNQVTSGFIIDTQAMKENKFYGEDQAEFYMLSNYRFEALKDVLAMHPGSQVLIWANYRREFEVISDMLGASCRCIYGATSLADKNAAIQGFKRGDIQYLVANPASADKGLTLTNCHICVYFSLNWSYELFKQSMDRIYGDVSKQPEKCLYYVLMATHTIDGVLYHDVLQGKGEASYAILNHLKPGGF